MAFNFDSCSSLAASKSSIFATTASYFASVSGISVRCFAIDLVSLADICFSTVNILKRLSHGHSKATKVFLNIYWRELGAASVQLGVITARVCHKEITGLLMENTEATILKYCPMKLTSHVKCSKPKILSNFLRNNLSWPGMVEI